jgi:Ribonuclease G/E
MTRPHTRLLIEDQPGERRMLLVEGESGAVLDLAVEMPGRRRRLPRVGDFYRGRVTRIERKLDAAFVDIDSDEPALLPLSRGPAGLSEGDRLPVKVIRAPMASKGARVTAKLSKNERALLEGSIETEERPGLLRPGSDPLEMMLDRGPSEVVVDGMSLYRVLRDRSRSGDLDAEIGIDAHRGEVPLLRAEGLDEEIEERLSGEVGLPSGGRVLIEPCETLTAVDVDSAGHRGAGGREAVARAVNLEAAAALAREARLRGLCGRLVVDFLAMERTSDRQLLHNALKGAFGADPEPVRIFSMRPSGLVEITRRRGRPPLHEILMQPVGSLGRGWVRHPTALAFDALRASREAHAVQPGRRLGLEVEPAVERALIEGDAAEARAALEARWGWPLELEGRPAGSMSFSVRAL